MALPVESPIEEYICPGQRSAISRAVHLGRLAQFYPACRECKHRDDTGTLSTRQVVQLNAARRRDAGTSLFHNEGVAGVFWNEIDPAVARRLGVALGSVLRRGRSHDEEGPVVVVASDGRSTTPELVAAAGEGLRWAGCHLIDVGLASAPCLAFSIDHLDADGGLLAGNPLGRDETAGLAFWENAAMPISAGGSLETLKTIFDTGADRPTRRFGSIRRLSPEAAYLAGFAEHYHALRPLRLALVSQPQVVIGYFERLVEETACRAASCPAEDRLGRQVLESRAHFGAMIDDDGQRCHLVDERGRVVPGDRLLLLMANRLLDDQPGATIVLDRSVPQPVAAELARRGGQVALADPGRQRMYAAMHAHQAIFGGGPSGQLWYRSPTGHVAPDALWSLTLLLELLSRSDRPLSDVLDAEAPGR